MKILNAQNRITELLREFSKRVELHNLTERYDINRVSETIMCPLLRLIFGYQEIRNLNYTDWRNYPGIDIADSERKIAFQITSTSDNDKVKDTLEKITRNRLYRRYDRFVLYVLTEKARRYTAKQYPSLTQDQFVFDAKEDIWDYRNLIEAVGQLEDTAQVRKIEQFLEDTFGKGQPFAWKKAPHKTETLLLNTVGIRFPETIYQADLFIDKEKLIERMRASGKRLRYPISDRTLVIEYLKNHGYQFPFDFVCDKNQLVTFHDLTNDEHPFRAVIDFGTVTPQPAENFYTINKAIDENRERVFKDLLRRSLVRMLKRHGVDWQEDENIFIFTMNENDDAETITLNQEKNRYERRVNWGHDRFVCLKKMKTQKPEEVLYYQHLAFSGRFYRLGEDWHLQINPTWFFSYDGYRKNDYLNYYLKWLKREEVNDDVKNDFLFTLWFFKNRMEHLFDKSFLKFAGVAQLSGAPELDDSLWNPSERTSISADAVAPDFQEDSESHSTQMLLDMFASEH